MPLFYGCTYIQHAVPELCMEGRKKHIARRRRKETEKTEDDECFARNGDQDLAKTFRKDMGILLSCTRDDSVVLYVAWIGKKSYRQ